MRSQNTLAAVLVVIGIMLIVGGLIVGSYTPPTCTDSSCLGPAWQPHAPLGAAMAIIGAIFVVVGALIAIVRAVSLAGTRSDHLAMSQASVAEVMAALPPRAAGRDDLDNPLACPICHQSDAIQSVPAAYIAETTEPLHGMLRAPTEPTAPVQQEGLTSGSRSAGMEQYLEKKARWDRTMRMWNAAYYCRRDGVVFLPTTVRAKNPRYTRVRLFQGFLDRQADA